MTSSTVPEQCPNESSSSNITMLNSLGENVEVPDRYICPITLEVFHKPLMTRNGRRFERTAIFAWLKAHRTCPLTRESLKLNQLVPDRAMEFDIEVWMLKNKITNQNDILSPDSLLDISEKILPETEEMHSSYINRLLDINYNKARSEGSDSGYTENTENETLHNSATHFESTITEAVSSSNSGKKTMKKKILKLRTMLSLSRRV